MIPDAEVSLSLEQVVALLDRFSIPMPLYLTMESMVKERTGEVYLGQMADCGAVETTYSFVYIVPAQGPDMPHTVQSVNQLLRDVYGELPECVEDVDYIDDMYKRFGAEHRAPSIPAVFLTDR